MLLFMKTPHIKACYVFPGQGTQFVGMGKDLYDKYYDEYEFIKEIFDKCNEILGFKVTDLMFKGPEKELRKTINCQPIMVGINEVYHRLLNENKKIPPCSLTLGHSVGGYSALVASKVLSLEDAIKLVKIRAKSMTECIPDETVKKGTSHMAAVLTDRLNRNNLINKYGKKCSAIELINEACEKYSSDNNTVGVANMNSVDQTVISGNNGAVIRAVKYLKKRNIKKIIYLPVEGPFHSKLMGPAAEVMKKALDDKNITINKPDPQYIINGKLISDPYEIKKALVEQICGTVEWKQSLEKAIEIGITTFIESGPGEKQYNLLNRDYKLQNKGLEVLVTTDYI